MKTSLIYFAAIALLATSCGAEKKLQNFVATIKDPTKLDAPTETKLPVGGTWKAELAKEEPNANQPSINAELTVYGNQVHQKTICSLGGYWVAATVMVPSTLDGKQITVLAGNKFSNPLKLQNGASFDCTAQLPTGIYTYTVDGSKLTIHPMVGPDLILNR